MTSLSFPDVNVWLALLLEDHRQRNTALRLLTTPAVMNDRPFTMAGTWSAYGRLFADDRVALVPEPADIEASFREYASGDRATPKLWADAYLLAFAEQAEGELVTFDRALAARGRNCLLLAGRNSKSDD